MKHLTDIDIAIKDFISKAQAVVDEHYRNYQWDNILTIKKGRRYEKIIATDTLERGSTRVWAFIDKTNGDVLKPASWRAPARGARGNLYDEFGGMKFIGPYGPAYMDTIKREEKENESA